MRLRDLLALLAVLTLGACAAAPAGPKLAYRYSGARGTLSLYRAPCADEVALGYVAPELRARFQAGEMVSAGEAPSVIRFCWAESRSVVYFVTDWGPARFAMRLPSSADVGDR